MVEKIFIGLNDNFHDPSFCIINEKGDLLFAEGIERSLQSKRGIGCPPDMDFYFEQIINQFYEEGEYDIYIASSWSKKIHIFSKYFDFVGFFNYDSKSLIRRLLKKLGAHRSFHTGSLRAAASYAQSGAGIFYLFNKWNINSNVYKKFYNHHKTHIVNSISCFNENNGIGIVIDGGGEGTAISIFKIENKRPKKVKTIGSTFSLGALYSIATDANNFSAYKGEEWKMMGLAPYGKSNDLIKKYLTELFIIKGNKYTTKTKILGKYVEEFKNYINRHSIPQEDVAFTTQEVFLEYVLHIVKYAQKLIPNQSNLYLSGGSALNSAALGKLTEMNLFKNVFIANAPADDGNAIGAAILAYESVMKNLPICYSHRSPYLGSSIENEALEKYITNSKLPFKKLEFPEKYAAQLLHENKIIGWIQGKAEFGPRALGNRSILAHPGFADNKDKINAAVKFRESFRPFAPSILHDHGPTYFEQYKYTPFMERTLTFKKEIIDQIQAVVHVNRTGRLQSVTKEMNEKYYNLISEFNKLSGIPLVVNTSYNVMGKPIAHSIHDAMAVFFESTIDALIINDYVIERNNL